MKREFNIAKAQEMKKNVDWKNTDFLKFFSFVNETRILRFILVIECRKNVEKMPNKNSKIFKKIKVIFNRLTVCASPNCTNLKLTSPNSFRISMTRFTLL